jgi:hypothetical protein
VWSLPSGQEKESKFCFKVCFVLFFNTVPGMEVGKTCAIPKLGGGVGETGQICVHTLMLIFRYPNFTVGGSFLPSSAAGRGFAIEEGVREGV